MGHGELLILDMRSSAPNNGAFQADGDSVIEPKIGAGVASHVESVFFLTKHVCLGLMDPGKEHRDPGTIRIIS